jgi:predicted nucleotidyltransferase
MNKQDKIVTYLKDKYDPEALILHGSRAAGQATENSDWDIFMFDDQELLSESGRGFGVELDVDAKKLPINTKKEVENEFGCQLKQAEVLLDTDGVGKGILELAEALYADGFNATQKEIDDKKNNLRRTYYRLAERSKHIAHLYRLDFVAYSTRYWYQILQNEWQDNFYFAFPRIKSEDPEYHENLMAVLESDGHPKRLASARWVHEKLFGEDLS